MPRRSNLDRRRLLEGTSLAALGLASGCAAPRRRTPPGERLNLGFVGVGNRAGANLAACAGENVVALCDIDDTFLRKAADRHPGAGVYHDFRRMLDREPLDAPHEQTTKAPNKLKPKSFLHFLGVLLLCPY